MVVYQFPNIFLVEFAFLLSITFINCTTCPIRFPHAFDGGRHCCAYKKEKPRYEYRGGHQDQLCDGGVIGTDSRCCENDQFIKCPGVTCETPSFDNDPCPSQFPYPYYHGLYCCKTSKEKAAFEIRNTTNYEGVTSYCSGNNITLESLCCHNNEFVKCVNPPCAGMDYRRLTWDSEGNDNPNDPNFSRKLRVPSADRGVTLGRGYDMSSRFSAFIKRDLSSLGIPQTQLISAASAKTGSNAETFITNNNLQNLTITHKHQWQLFKLTTKQKADEARQIFSGFDSKDESIKGLVIDLMIRGDWTSSIRSSYGLDAKVNANDVTALRDVMMDRAKWSDVPLDRFNRRKDYMVKAASL